MAPHTTTYYLEINGKPSCVSEVSPRSKPGWACSQGTDLSHAEQARAHVLRDHPDAVVLIREGYCPASAAFEEEERERRDAEEEHVRALLEDRYDE
jgi:hypothetical protein